MSKSGVAKFDNIENVKFPVCYKNCEVAHYLGCGECESVCPEKFLQKSKEPECSEQKSKQISGLTN